MSEVISPSEYRRIVVEKRTLLDVRASIEVLRDHLPNSVNEPILNNEERAHIGTVFRKQGRDHAVQVGEQLVSGENKKNKIVAWQNFAKAHPNGVLTCFRGGLRSQIAQAWLAEAGFVLPRLQTGTKGFKNFLRSESEKFLNEKTFYLITGLTGSGKTDLIKAFPQRSCDLEHYANHRGSAFGGAKDLQPAQSSFENHLGYRAVELSEVQGPIFVEDESRMIGGLTLPENWFQKMRESAVVLVEEPLSERVERIFQQYVLRIPAEDRTEHFRGLLHSLESLSRKLGGVRFGEVKGLLAHALIKSEMGDLHSNREWIEKLLVYYYDPLYQKSLQKRNPLIRFRGSYSEVETFLSQGE